MRWSDPQDRADRRLRHGIWTAALIAVLLPIWWNVVSTVWAAILVHATVQALTQSALTNTAPSLPSTRTRPVSALPITSPPVVRVLGASGGGDTVTVLVDLQGAAPSAVSTKICVDGAAFAGRSLAGQDVRVLSWHGTVPATEAGTVMCQ